MSHTYSPRTLASIDLGSNSFHLLVAKVNEFGELEKLDSLRESVRLGEGLTYDKMLTPEVQEKALRCLELFRQRIDSLPADSVRVAGTNTLRRAHNTPEFLLRAKQALGRPIEVISGHEEARLIYLGVANGHETTEGKRFVIDIGGGSTELILGEGDELHVIESLELGCVTLSKKYFSDGVLTHDRFERAITQAKLAIFPVYYSVAQMGWSHVIGCSGTIKGIRKVIQKQGWSKSGITLEALHSLRDGMVRMGHIDELEYKSLKEERKPVLAGGLSALIALFEIFQIEHMNVSKQALREGLLYDLIGRLEHKDIRSQSIRSLIERWDVDVPQAHRVAETAEFLFQQVHEDWGLESPELPQFLQWSALVHELGLHISHRRYHQHSAYVLTHADLPGFSFQEQTFLAILVLNHRRKFKFLRQKELPEALVGHARYLCVLLRLAFVLCRKRLNQNPPVVAEGGDNEITLRFPAQWLNMHPLIRADLEKESQNLTHSNIQLNLIEE